MSTRLPVYLCTCVLVYLFLLAACTSPQRLPIAPTPIPTLIPATLPPGGLERTQTPSLVVESYPAGLPSAEAGRALYAEHCAECHGADGNGLVPNARNFGDVDFTRGETPAEFYLVVSEGRGEMPAFGETFSSDQRWDLVYFVWRFATTDETLLKGHGIYAANCVACHGEDGRSMILGAANFSDQRFMTKQSPSDLYVAVTQGRGSMPAWQARLSQDERWAVIDYVRTFTYAPTLSGAVALPTSQPAAAPQERPECAPYLAETNRFGWDNAEAIAAGQALYDRCAGCHGQDGVGTIPGVPDFTDPSIQANLRKEAGNYLCAIAEGLDAMPAWKDTLSTDEMWQVLTFLANLGK